MVDVSEYVGIFRITDIIMLAEKAAPIAVPVICWNMNVESSCAY